MFHRTKEDFYRDSRFEGIQPLELKLWLSSPTMHGDELRWVEDAIESNWVTTLGANVDAVEKGIAEKTGRPLKEVQKLCRADSYFNSEESLKFGLSTEILRKLPERSMMI